MHLVSKKLLLVGLATLIIATAACAGGDSGGSADGAGGGGGSDSGPVPIGAPAEPQGSGEESSGGGGGSDGSTVEYDSGSSTNFGGLSAAATSVGPSIIKTADLELKVPHEDFEEAVRDAEGIAGEYGGFILASNIREGEFLTGTVSIRVPSRDFEDALTEMSALGKIKNESTSGHEVSQEFIDLEARLRNWRVQEAVILSLMDRSTSIEDTIRVQTELSAIQLEIEQLRGRLNFLRDQTAFGTITASFVTGAAPAPAKPSPFVRAWRQAVDTMTAIASGLVLSLGVVIPMLILLLLIWLIIRQLRPRLTN